MSNVAPPAVRVDRIRTGLRNTLLANLSGVAVSWARGDVPDDQLGSQWLSLQILNGPSPRGWGAARGIAIPRIVNAVLRVTPADAFGEPKELAEGDSAFLAINNVLFHRAAEDSETVTDVRDALVAWANSEPGVTAIASDEDEITLTPSVAGGLFDVRTAGILDVFDYSTSGLVALTGGQYRALIEAQTFCRAAPDASLFPDAQALAATVQSLLYRRDISDALDFYGIGLAARENSILDISALAGPEWQSRAQFTFGVYVYGATARPIDSIDNVSGVMLGTLSDLVIPVKLVF